MTTFSLIVNGSSVPTTVRSQPVGGRWSRRQAHHVVAERIVTIRMKVGYRNHPPTDPQASAMNDRMMR